MQTHSRAGYLQFSTLSIKSNSRLSNHHDKSVNCKVEGSCNKFGNEKKTIVVNLIGDETGMSLPFCNTIIQLVPLLKNTNSDFTPT